MVSRQTTRPLRKLLPAAAIGVSALLGIVGCSAGQVAQTAEMPPAVNGNAGQVGDLALRDVQVAFPDSGEAYQEGDDAPLLLRIINTGDVDDELVAVTSPVGEVRITGNPSIPARTALQVVLPGETSGEATETSESSESSESSSGSSVEPTGSSAGQTSSEETGVETTETNESTGIDPTGAGPGTGANGDQPSGEVSTPGTTQPPTVGIVSLVITGLTAELPFGKTVPVTFEFANAGKVTINLPIAAPPTARPESTEGAEAGEH
jgi:copper(I)-binding protein